MRTKFLSSLKQFQKEEGNVSFESVFWVPFFTLFLTLIADVTFIFYGQARAHDVAQMASRAYSIGNLETTEAAASYIEDQLTSLSPNVSARVKTEDGMVTAVVTLPTGDLGVVGVVPALMQINMEVVAQMVKES